MQPALPMHVKCKGTCACKPRLQPSCADVEALPDMVPSSASWPLALQLWSALAGSQRSDAGHNRNYDCKALQLRATDTSSPRCVPAGSFGCQSLIPVHTYELQPLASVPLRSVSALQIASITSTVGPQRLLVVIQPQRPCAPHKRTSPASQQPATPITRPLASATSLTCVLATLCLSSLLSSTLAPASVPNASQRASVASGRPFPT